MVVPTCSGGGSDCGGSYGSGGGSGSGGSSGSGGVPNWVVGRATKSEGAKVTSLALLEDGGGSHPAVLVCFSFLLVLYQTCLAVREGRGMLHTKQQCQKSVLSTVDYEFA